MRAREDDAVLQGRPPVLVLNAFSGEGMGGGEVQTLHLIRGLAQRGINVHLASPPSQLAGEARDAGITVHECEFRAVDLAVVHSGVREIIASTGCSIVQGTGFLTNIVARRMKRASAPMVVNTVHVMPGASLYESGSRTELFVRRLVDRGTLDRVDALIAVSEAVARGLEEARLVPPSGVHVIRNGIDVEAVVSQSSAPTAGLPAGEGPLIGYLGRLERVKGPDLFVLTCEELARRRPDLRFAIAGSGSMGDAVARALRRACGERAAALRRVANGPAFLRALDLLVIPSRSEAISLAALEAMAVGTPIVATEVGGLADLIRASGAGVLVPPENAIALADAVERVLGDPVLAAHMSASGREHVRRFSVENMVDEYIGLYRSLLSGAFE